MNGWHRALDAQIDFHKWLISNDGLEYLSNFFTAIDKNATQDELVHQVTHFIETVYRGDTIYMTTDMLHVLLQAAHDLPDDVTFDMRSLLTPIGFVVFEEPIDGLDRTGAKITMHGIAWEHGITKVSEDYPEQKEMVMLYYLTDPTDFNDEFNVKFVEGYRETDRLVPPFLIVHKYPLLDGASAPQVGEIGSEIVVGIVRIFMVVQLLAQQTIGTPMKLRPERHVRKRAENYYKDMPERLITLITLRRKSAPSTDDNKQPIPWTRRWMVRGHWRRQYYPSLKRHDWKYIYEHVKGPEDKPLIITERRVFNFRR